MTTRTATRELLHRPISWITLILSLLVVCSFTVAGWSFYAGHRDACVSRNRTLDAVRDVFVVFKEAVAKSPHQTPDDRKRAHAFFKVAFAKLEAARCK